MPAVLNDNAGGDDLLALDADPARMARTEMERRAAEVAGLLKTLSHPLRLMLVCALVEGEYGVGALEERIGIGQPTLSQHLGVLRAAGIVETRREAKQIFYRLTDAKAARLVDALYTIFCAEEGTP